MNKTAQSNSSSAIDGPVRLPAHAFFVRRISLDPVAAAGLQVELALETSAPFALEQLYYGYLTAPDGLTALVYATHRRIYPGEAWPNASVVLPAFAALLGEPPPGSWLRLWQDDGSLMVAAWDGSGPLPCLLLAQPTEPATEAAARTTLLEAAVHRLGGRMPDIEEFAGPADVNPGRKGQGLELRLKVRDGNRSLVTRLAPAALESMDVRDKTDLAVRRSARRRDRLLWSAFASALAGIALATLLEGVLLAGGVVLKGWRTEQARVAEDVRKIETAQSLGTRIDEMTQRRLRPFEMLAVLNEARPASIQFLRCVTSGFNTLEIEGQTGDAGSVGVFESTLRGLPELERMEIRDVRLREGTTNFQLTAVFKTGGGNEPEVLP